MTRCGQQEKSSLVDAKGECLKSWRPQALVDAILAKKIWELRGDGGNHHWSGPGFCAGYDVDYVVETKRGHNLGVPLRKAVQLPIREFPELWAVLARSASSMHLVQASLQVQPKLRILWSRDRKLRTSEIPGCASPDRSAPRMIRDGYEVYEGMKIADIDPRKDEKENCYTISDKARCIAGGVVEILCQKEFSYGTAKKLEIAEKLIRTCTGSLPLWAAGKTSLIFRLTEELVSLGKRIVPRPPMAYEKNRPLQRMDVRICLQVNLPSMAMWLRRLMRKRNKTLLPDGGEAEGASSFLRCSSRGGRRRAQPLKVPEDWGR